MDSAQWWPLSGFFTPKYPSVEPLSLSPFLYLSLSLSLPVQRGRALGVKRERLRLLVRKSLGVKREQLRLLLETVIRRKERAEREQYGWKSIVRAI